MQRVFTFKFYKKNSNLKEKDLLFTQILKNTNQHFKDVYSQLKQKRNEK